VRLHCDDRIDQIAPQCSKPRKSAILVCTYQPTVSDYIGNKYRRDFPCLVHAIPIAQKSAPPDNASKLHLLRTDVRFGSKADARTAKSNVRFAPKGRYSVLI
jgi:hypothetical protein